MDFAHLGETIIKDSVDQNDNYAKVGTEERQATGKLDNEKAKAFLLKTYQGMNLSLYDHLADVIKTVLRLKIPNAVDKLEKISFEVKKMRQKPESDLIEVLEIPEELQAFMKEKQAFYKFKTFETRSKENVEDEDDDEEDESDEEATAVDGDSAELIVEEPDLSEALPDIYYIMSRFNEAGIGLSPIEIFELVIALKDLVIEFKLKKVRFWGKVFGIRNDYYIAEAPFQCGIVQENYGWENAQKSTEKLEEETKEEDENENEKDEDGDKVEEESDEEEEEKKNEVVKEPPIPEPKPKIKKKIPAEKNGTGVNEYLYFVCTRLGQPWRVLPFMLPSHISEARYLKRFLTGDLESQIRGVYQYPGKEAHYLRAQIARITASSYIAPVGFYKTAGEDEDEEEKEDAKDAGEIVVNSEFEPKSVKCLFAKGVEGWCHYRKAILHQGRCIPMKTEEKENGEDTDDDTEDDKEDNEKEDSEISEAIFEKQVSILRCLSEDKALKELKPWIMKLSSKLVEEKAVLICYSNIWPEAYTFYDGKTFEHIYIGYGFKQAPVGASYAPPIRIHGLSNEYEVGDDVIEDIDDETFPKEESENDDEDLEVGEEDNKEIEEEEN